jgi:hypothetical protein
MAGRLTQLTFDAGSGSDDVSRGARRHAHRGAAPPRRCRSPNGLATIASFCPRLGAFAVLAVCGLCARAVPAATVTYSFDAPDFVVGQTTPFVNKAPSTGSTTFRASFTSASNPAGFLIVPVDSTDFFTGNVFYDLALPGDAFTMTFNQLVNRVELNWAIFEAGRLAVSTASPADKLSQDGIAFGNGVHGNVLVFTSATPFDMVRLEAFGASNAPTQLAFDNLVLNVVPEPATIMLMAVGLGGAAFLQSRARGWQRR